VCHLQKGVTRIQTQPCTRLSHRQADKRRRKEGTKVQGGSGHKERREKEKSRGLGCNAHQPRSEIGRREENRLVRTSVPLGRGKKRGGLRSCTKVILLSPTHLRRDGTRGHMTFPKALFVMGGVGGDERFPEHWGHAGFDRKGESGETHSRGEFSLRTMRLKNKGKSVSQL